MYRALEFLLEHGFVHKIESLNAFVSCPHPQQPHRTQFLICDACQLTVELDDPVLDRQLQEQARKQGFRARMKTAGGRKIINAKRRRGNHKLNVAS